MSKLSIILPVRNELYLNETVADIFAHAAGDVEVIAVLDGCWNLPLPPDDPRLTIIHRTQRLGMRSSINTGAAAATGDYIMKLDAHCSLCPGFDEILLSDIEDNWIVVPKRYSLDADTWTQRTDKAPVVYEYIEYPQVDKNTKIFGMHAKPFRPREAARAEYDIDEDMIFQGSCWVMSADHWRKRIVAMDDVNYGTFCVEALEIGLRTWLGGGAVMVNKRAWYAHLYKGESYRDKYFERHGERYSRVGRSELVKSNKFGVDYWFNNRWPERVHDYAWLVEKFYPIPGWPKERELWTSLRK